MSNRNKIRRKRRTEQRSGLKTPSEQTDTLLSEQKPIFSFHYLDKKYCISKCNKNEKAAFADTMRKLSELTWTRIASEPKHGLGYEKIPKGILKGKVPKNISPDVMKFVVFRFHTQAAMVGYRDNNIFHVIWFDRNFTLYDHGS